MIVKLPKMNREEIQQLMREQFLCRISFRGEEYPYMAPFQYVVMNGALYFHFTGYGKKMRLLEEDSKVCVEIERYTPNLSEYSFVVLRGTLKEVEDRHERAEAISRLAEVGSKRLSESFLPAHGFEKEAGWAALSPDAHLVIVKLEKVVEEVGLKSP
jgi:nitroimidazol reductase NimA-like FMN-containing flavoprotein (pyridoxamine 5'-phosphate oxidase superfamily)